MTKNIGSELLICLLLRTGLRLNLVASMLGMSKTTIQDWIANTNLIKAAPATFVKGMHIQPEGFLRCRFKGLAGYVFFQMFAKVKGHIQSCYQIENEKFLVTCAFIVAHELFQKEYGAHFARFASDADSAKQITASQLWQFVRFTEAGLIRAMQCQCGRVGPESLTVVGEVHCSCRPPARNKKYWVDFGSAINRTLASIDDGVIASQHQVDAALQRLLLAASFSILGIVEQPA